MTNTKELIMKVGMDGGSLSAFRQIAKDGNTVFTFGTNEMGLDDDSWGVTTSSKAHIMEVAVLLEKIRENILRYIRCIHFLCIAIIPMQ